MKAKLVGMNHAEAAKIAYPKAKVPKDVGKQVIKRPAVQKAIKEALQDNNVTPDRVAEVISDGLDATQVDFEGNERKDHITRHKFADMSLKVLGGYSPELHAHAHKHSLTDSMLKDLDEGKI